MRILLAMLYSILLMSLLTGVAFANHDIDTSMELNTRLDLEYNASGISPYSPYLNTSFRLTVTDNIASDRYGRLVAELGTPIGHLFRLREAFLDFYFESIDLRVGYQRIPWGKADGYNPTDLFNPIDYNRPFTEDNYIGIPAFRMKYYRDEWIVDAVWVPFFTPSQLPQEGDRWAVDTGEFLLPPGYSLNQVEFKPEVKPEAKLVNSEFGIRISRWSAEIDTSVSYFHGWQKTPFSYIMTEEVSAGLLNVIIEPKYYKINAFGFDFAKSIKEYVLRGEAAYVMTEDGPDGPGSYFSYILGFDSYPSDESYLNLQVFGEKEIAGENQLGLMVSYHYDVSDYSQLELNGVYHFIDKDFVINPKYTKEISDDMILSIGAYLFFGQENTDFGSLSDKDFIFLELKKVF